MEDIGLLLNYIEDEVRTKKGALFGSVNKDAILNYVQRIRESLPDALSEKRIREETLKAQNIIALAEKKGRNAQPKPDSRGSHKKSRTILQEPTPNKMSTPPPPCRTFTKCFRT